MLYEVITILELYLNKIPLGYRAFGIGAAAQVYYGKTVQELTLGQMAVLAGLPKAPSLLNPIRSPQRALARRNLVLSRMLELGKISQQEYDTAVREPVVSRYHGTETVITSYSIHYTKLYETPYLQDVKYRI